MIHLHDGTGDDERAQRAAALLERLRRRYAGVPVIERFKVGDRVSERSGWVGTIIEVSVNAPTHCGRCLPNEARSEALFDVARTLEDALGDAAREDVAVLRTMAVRRCLEPECRHAFIERSYIMEADPGTTYKHLPDDRPCTAALVQDESLTLLLASA